MPKVFYTFDPFKATGEKLPEGADRDQVKQDVAEFVREQVVGHMDRKTSPVDGWGKFDPLSKAYKERKKAAGLPGVPDLEFSGALKDAINARPVSRGVRLEVDSSEAGKADGHCNLSGKSSLPTRRFIPAKDETFNDKIIDGIRRIIRNGGS